MLKKSDLTWIVDERNLREEDRGHLYLEAEHQALFINNVAEASFKEVFHKGKDFEVYTHYDCFVAVVRKEAKGWVIIPATNIVMTPDDISVIDRILCAIDCLSHWK